MNFRLIPMSHLGRAHFDEWPVWSEYYDRSELDDIQAWGLDPAAFLAQERELDLGDEHAAYPVLNYDPLPERMRLYVKAVFVTRSGHVLNGFVVNDDAYAGAVFLGDDDDEVEFNIHLSESCSAALATLALRLGSSVDQLLPIRYETDVHSLQGHKVAGVLTFRPSPPPN